MFYAPRVTATVTVGWKYSCAMFQERTTNMRHHTVASMSTHLPQLQFRLRVSPDRAPVPMPLLNHRLPTVIAGKGSEV